MKTKKYIVLWGATGFQNMGDEAMLAANIEVFKKSNYGVIVWSNHPEATSQLHNVIAKPDFNRLIEEETKGHKRIIKGLLFLLASLKLWLNIKRIRRNKSLRFLLPLEKEFITILANSEALLIAGGGNLNDIFVRGGLIARGFISFLARMLDKPVFLGAQTVGPLNKRWTRLLTRKFLERVHVITLRENFSKNVLKEIRVKHEGVKVVPDDAFNIAPINKKDALNLLLNEGIDINKIKKERKKIIAITPRAWWEIDDKNIPLKVALEKIIGFLVKQDRNYIIFVPTSFYQGPGDDDIKTSMELLSKIRISGDANFKILSGKYNWSQLKGILNFANVAIGTSYHSIVFAASMGVPALGLYVDEYYRLKIGGFLDLMGCGNLAVDVKKMNENELINILNNFLEKENVLRERLIKKIDEVKEDSCYAAKQLIRILKKEKV
jgi:N-acetylglucosaminyldiphosphoundecaprenol N-acetyl-beta-D-mannosaminyltransferase